MHFILYFFSVAIASLNLECMLWSMQLCKKTWIQNWEPVSKHFLCCSKWVIKDTCCFWKHQETGSVFSRWIDELASELYQFVTSTEIVVILHSQDILGLSKENDRVKGWFLFQYFVCKMKTNQLAVFVSTSGMLWKSKSVPTDLLIL